MIADASAILAGQLPGAPGTLGNPPAPPGNLPQLFKSGTLATIITAMSFDETLRPRLADILHFLLKKPGADARTQGGTLFPFLTKEKPPRNFAVFTGFQPLRQRRAGSGGRN
jgi:hypothetical protein